MSNIKYNGTSLESLGIIVEKIPPIIKGARRYQKYTIPGRNGVLWVDEETYEPFTINLECHFNEDNVDVDWINKSLNLDGKLSLDGVRYYEAYINNIIEYEKVQYFRKFILSFLCNPISYEIAEQVYTYNPNIVNQMELPGNAFTDPIIEVIGSGQIIISINTSDPSHSRGFTLNANGSQYPYKIDCAAKEITQNGINMSADMSGEFPTLAPNVNVLNVSGTGTITSIKVKYHNAYL